MSEIYINTCGIGEQVVNLKKVTTRINSLIEEMQVIISSDEMKKKNFAEVRNRLEKDIVKLKKIKEKSTVLYQSLDEINNLYIGAEHEMLKEDEDIRVRMYAATKRTGKQKKQQTSGDVLEKLWKKFERFCSRMISMKFDKILFRAYLVKELAEMAFDEGDFNEKLEKATLKFIQSNIHDSSVLGAMAFLAMINNISDETIDKHFKNNKKIWNDYKERKRFMDKKDKYIEDQNSMEKFKYGVQNDFLSDGILNGKKLTGAVNTCEVIAAYNALVALNDGKSNISFPSLLKKFEKSGIMLDGYFGTSPDSIAKYFEDNGYDTRMLVGMEINDKTINKLDQKYDTYIFTGYNDKNDINRGIHTMSITAEVDYYTKSGKPVYNYVIHNGDMGEVKCESLEAALNTYKCKKEHSDFELISIIGIK